ncbi:unnamed protein product, partial [Schistosoma bovis]
GYWILKRPSYHLNHLGCFRRPRRMRPVKCLFTVFESVVASASSRAVIGSECKDLVKGYSGACFKKFTSYDEAIKFIEGGHEVGTVLLKKRRIGSMNDDLDGRDRLPSKLSPEEHYISSNHVPSTLTFYHDIQCMLIFQLLICHIYPQDYVYFVNASSILSRWTDSHMDLNPYVSTTGELICKLFIYLVYLKA